MIYLVGGPARTGKSVLYRGLRAVTGGDAAELDPLRRSFVHFAGAAASDVTLAPREHDHTPESWLAELRRRDDAVWAGVLPWLAEHQERHGGSILVVGCLWPHHASELRELPHRAVFTADTSAGHTGRVLASARGSGPNNWHSHRTAEDLAVWADYNRHRSRAYAAEATDEGYPLADVAEHDGYADPHARMQSAAAAALGFTLPPSHFTAGVQPVATTEEGA